MNWLKSAFDRGQSDQQNKDSEARERRAREEARGKELFDKLKSASGIFRARNLSLHFDKLTKYTEKRSVILYERQRGGFITSLKGGNCIVATCAIGSSGPRFSYGYSSYYDDHVFSFDLGKTPEEAAEALLYGLGAGTLHWCSRHEVLGSTSLEDSCFARYR